MSDTSADKTVDLVPPRAAALIESLRAFGYSLRSAVADLVDNSVTAQASTVSGTFWWNGENSWFALRDDGWGMTEEELIEAMRLGTRSPLDLRGRDDLGRFGLGLKTASFSQCRRLTVLSKKSATLPILRCWDLDHVERTDRWELLRAVPESTREIIARQELGDHGTVVIWERMDHVTRGMSADNHKHHDLFNQLATEVREHLAMVFQDFLGGRRTVRIFLNDRPVVPWDPFLDKHPGTQVLGDESIPFKEEIIRIRPFVLPHHSRLDVETHTRAAGPAGWNAQQGFYVYRSNRLIVPGSWLGLGFQKEEHYKLARIRVDIPNTVDEEWSIDVRKSRARPPAVLRERLLAIAKKTRQRAADVYRHRGKIISRASHQSVIFPWLQKMTRGKQHYAINREHPLFVATRDDLAGNTRNFVAFLRLIEETIPVPAITINASEKPDAQRQPFDGDLQELLEIAGRTFDALIATSVSAENAVQRVLTMEPFSLYVDEVQNYLEARTSHP